MMHYLQRTQELSRKFQTPWTADVDMLRNYIAVQVMKAYLEGFSDATALYRGVKFKEVRTASQIAIQSGVIHPEPLSVLHTKHEGFML